MTQPLRRIYTYKNRRDYVYVANLTDKPRYFAYIGRMGYLLPPLTKDSVPMLMLIRPYKGLRKRKRQQMQMEADCGTVLAMGTYDEVLEAMNKKRT